eukprot:4643257-Amphidinium_carterae.1
MKGDPEVKLSSSRSASRSRRGKGAARVGFFGSVEDVAAADAACTSGDAVGLAFALASCAF